MEEEYPVESIQQFDEGATKSRKAPNCEVQPPIPPPPPKKKYLLVNVPDQ